MTPPGADSGAGELSARIAAQASEALCNALNGMVGGGFEAAATEGREVAIGEDSLVWRQPFSVSDDGVVWLVAGKDLWNAVGQLVLGGEGAEAAGEEDCRSTWDEIAGQTMGGVARSLSAELGREITAQGGVSGADGPDDQALVDQTRVDQNQGVVLEVRHSTGSWLVRMAWNNAFAEGCATLSQNQVEEIPALAPAAAKPAMAAPAERANSAAGVEALTSKTLDLLMDVALPVSVSFGRTSLQLREVLKLNTGSVVELDRLVSEPVEVIVNNCVIARGEVVVVDGNYGVRVIHLASRADRLRSGMTEATNRLGAAR